MASFAIAGHCVPPSEALQLFKLQFPQVRGDSVTSFHSGSVSQAGVLTYQLKTLVVLPSRAINLPSCSPEQSGEAFSMTSALTVFSFFFTAVLFNYFISRQIGTVIDFIKRH